MKYCPACNLQMNGNNCSSCGGRLEAMPSTGASSTALIGLMLIVAVICVVLGFVLSDTVLQQISLFALAAVFGIFARIAQAAKHHTEMMNKR